MAATVIPERLQSLISKQIDCALYHWTRFALSVNAEPFNFLVERGELVALAFRSSAPHHWTMLPGHVNAWIPDPELDEGVGDYQRMWDLPRLPNLEGLSNLLEMAAHCRIQRNPEGKWTLVELSNGNAAFEPLPSSSAEVVIKDRGDRRRFVFTVNKSDYPERPIGGSRLSGSTCGEKDTNHTHDDIDKFLGDPFIFDTPGIIELGTTKVADLNLRDELEEWQDDPSLEVFSVPIEVSRFYEEHTKLLKKSWLEFARRHNARNVVVQRGEVVGLILNEEIEGWIRTITNPHVFVPNESDDVGVTILLDMLRLPKMISSTSFAFSYDVDTRSAMILYDTRNKCCVLAIDRLTAHGKQPAQKIPHHDYVKKQPTRNRERPKKPYVHGEPKRLM